MKYGFYLPNSGAGVQPDALASIAKQGDNLGFYCMVMPDHILQPNQVNSTYPYSLTGDILEAGTVRGRRVARTDNHPGLARRYHRAHPPGDQCDDHSLPQSHPNR